MHELSLYGQVPVARHDQLLNILAGIAAMQPRRVLERHLIYKPSKIPSQRVKVGGSQEISSQKTNAAQQAPKEVFYMQLVSSVPHDEQESVSGDGDTIDVNMDDVPDSAAKQTPWLMQFQDIPEPGKRDVVSRLVTSTKLTEGDAHQFMKGLGYE
jgi:mediator of RNA polymerase II transcription subunit 18, fungi type